jgi:hypothetical protein
MRELAESTSKELGVRVFPYHFSFITNEGLLLTFPYTMWTLGIAVISVVVVTLIFLPHPFMVRSAVSLNQTNVIKSNANQIKSNQIKSYQIYVNEIK